MSLLKNILPILASSTLELNLSIKRCGKDEVLVRVAPVIGEVSEDASDLVRQLKSALSVPLKVVGTVEVIESTLTQRVASYQAKRNQWQNQVLSIESGFSKDAAIQQGSAKNALETVEVADEVQINDKPKNDFAV